MRDYAVCGEKGFLSFTNVYSNPIIVYICMNASLYMLGEYMIVQVFVHPIEFDIGNEGNVLCIFYIFFYHVVYMCSHSFFILLRHV